MFRADELRDLIRAADKSYWVENAPTMEDVDYDALVRELRSLCPDDPLLNKIGSYVKPDANDRKIISSKITHATPLLSLDKVYTVEELCKWAESISRAPTELFVVQIKYDGITCDADRGCLSTRGDGICGENITDKASIIDAWLINGKHCPMSKVLSQPNKRRIGELVITDTDFSNTFSKINSIKGVPYKNQRNATAGIVSLDDISYIKSMGGKLTFIEYGNHQIVVRCKDIAKKWHSIVSTFDGIGVPKDGLVLKLVDKAYSESLGCTSHHPRGQIAFKFQNIKRLTHIVGIEWTVGKEKVVPTAILEPIEINGSTITKATLHNYKNIKDNSIAIGDRVMVERGGDVIPWISSVFHEDTNAVSYPMTCPICGTILHKGETHLTCPNSSCNGKQAIKIEYGLKVLDVLGVGEATIEQSIQTMDIANICDWFVKMGNVNSLLEHGFKPAISKLIADCIKSMMTKPIEAAKVLASLAIPGVGLSLARTIIGYYPNLQMMIHDPLLVLSLCKIPSIGPGRANNIAQFIADNKSMITLYISMFKLTYPDDHVDSRPTVCFTGEMPTSRDKLKTMAIGIGWKPVDSVTEQLSYLVIPDEECKPTSKIKKAIKFDITMLRYSDFIKKL